MRHDLRLALFLPALACFSLLPNTAFAHGIYVDFGDIVTFALTLATPVLLLTMFLMKGSAKTRLHSVFATLFVFALFAPVLIFAVFMLGWYGVLVAAALPFLVALYINRPAKKGEAPTPQSVSSNFGNIFSTLLLIGGLVLAYAVGGSLFKQWNDNRQTQKQAEAGSVDAMNKLAFQASDPAELVKWQRMAADHGDRLSMHKMADRYRSGDGVPRDAKLALEFYLKAGQDLNLSGIVTVAEMYQKGEGTPKNMAEAVKWYKTAIDRSWGEGKPALMQRLGKIYETGDGVPADPAEAHYWYAHAAAVPYGLQSEASVTRVAALLTPDQIAASQARVKAALANTPAPPAAAPLMAEAMKHRNHSPMTAEKYAEAAKWLRQAAEFGNAEAAAMLCVQHLHGKGVPQDYAEAFFWCLLSKQRYALDSTSYYGADNPDTLAEQARNNLTVSQVDDAERRLREWQPKAQP